MIVKQIDLELGSIVLLPRVREILRLFQLSAGNNLDNILAELGVMLDVSIFIVDCKGKLIASKSCPSYYECSLAKQKLALIKPYCFSNGNHAVVKECLFKNDYFCKNFKHVKNIPFYRGNELIGHLLIVNFEEPLAKENIYLSEIIAIFLNRNFVSILEKEKNEDARNKLKLQSVLNNLSYSGEKFFFLILQNFETDKFTIKTNIKAMADQNNISPPVITRTLKLLQSAGIIEHRSLGSKGSIIRITDSYLQKNFDSIVKDMLNKNQRSNS
ncbi:MAG: hypothetical protein Q7J85_11985 [Bacillota bacterium]|nr:hypothetical protein [Bacillota bacterium]